MAADSPPVALGEVVRTGGYRESLEALRDVLAASVDQVDAKDRAPLAKQLADVLSRLDGLPNPEEVSRLDELARHRAIRRGEAPVDPDEGQQRRRGGGRASS